MKNQIMNYMVEGAIFNILVNDEQMREVVYNDDIDEAESNAISIMRSCHTSDFSLKDKDSKNNSECYVAVYELAGYEKDYELHLYAQCKQDKMVEFRFEVSEVRPQEDEVIIITGELF